MTTIKAIIIEDEKRSQIYLKGLLEEIAPQVVILDVCDDLPSGVMAIRRHKPDLVFLDIEMPKYSGLEIVHFFDASEMNFSIIFTTAYSQYAIQAFKTSALDYLLKPIDPDELVSTISRYEKLKKPESNQWSSIQNMVDRPTKITIPDGQKILVIDTHDIIYLKADNSYTQVFLKDNKTHVTSRFLKNFEETLRDYPHFFRCHKSYIINIDYMMGYSKSDGGTILMTNGIEIPVSQDKMEDLFKHFNKVNR